MPGFGWTKLPNGDWGVRVWDGPEDLAGQGVTVTAKNGRESIVQLDQQVSIDRKVQLYSVVPEKNGNGKPAPEDLPGPDVVPAGRYAIPVLPEHWMFVRVWRGSKNPNVVRVYVAKGDHNLERGEQVSAEDALDRIIKFGVTQSAQEFGWRTGHCGRCGLELDVNLSRKLGVGPTCLLKVMMTREGANALRAEARRELRLAGLDPAAKADSLVGV